MERMHPEDLRAKLAMELYKLYNLTETDDPSHEAAICEAGDFLAKLSRTAKPDPEPVCPEPEAATHPNAVCMASNMPCGDLAEALNRSDALQAKVRELEAQNRHDDEADTACRNLLMEENDALRARVKDLEFAGHLVVYQHDSGEMETIPGMSSAINRLRAAILA
jgi:hypothetical protein